MTPLIISTRRSDATLRAIRSVTIVGNVSTFLTSSIRGIRVSLPTSGPRSLDFRGRRQIAPYLEGDPTGTQPPVGLTPRTIANPASFMVGPAGLEPAASSTPSSRGRSPGSPDLLACAN